MNDDPSPSAMTLVIVGACILCVVIVAVLTPTQRNMLAIVCVSAFACVCIAYGAYLLWKDRQ